MQRLKSQIKKFVNRILETFGVAIVRKSTVNNYRLKSLEYIQQIEGAMRELSVLNLPKSEMRLQRLLGLKGTSVCEGLYICEYLYRAKKANGAVCEFGVAQGATSALLAEEILETDQILWLYDSFQGLPAPSDKDVLIDDIFNLGSMSKYQGSMVSPITSVQNQLAAVGFPAKRTQIVEGFFDGSPGTAGPDTIMFAYIDFDFYQPILDALAFVDPRMPPGGRVVVDDYGWFSAGAQLAVDEFMEANKERWIFEVPREFCGKFCMLTKTA